MHWFEHRLPLEPEWQAVRPKLEKIASGFLRLWAEQKTRVDRYGIEASLEQAFIQPVFQLLGWKLKYQTFLLGVSQTTPCSWMNEALGCRACGRSQRFRVFGGTQPWLPMPKRGT